MENKKRFETALIINSICAIFGFISCTMAYYNNNNYWSSLRYYTVLSNLFAAITSFIWICHGFYNLGKGNFEVPSWVQKIHFISTSCLLLTFVVVLAILIPQDYSKNGSIAFYNYLFKPVNFFHHLTLPVLAIISISCFEKKPEMNFKITLLSLLPTAMYAVVCIFLNLIRVLDGPYFFVRIYNQSWYMTVIWCVVVMSLNFGLACGLYGMNKRGR